MIRVLHVVHAVTRGGGLSNVVMNYYRNIDRTKVQFDFLYFKETEKTFTEEIEMLGGRVFKLNEPSLKLDSRREIEEFFKAHKNEWLFLHCHALFAVGIFSKIARKYGCQFVVAHSHSSEYGTSRLKKLRNFVFVKMAKRLSDFHFACSDKAGVFMFGKNNYTLLKNAINAEKFRYSGENRKKVRDELGIDESTFVIGHIGGFTISKNHNMLIRIFDNIQKQIPDSCLVLVGGDSVGTDSAKSKILLQIDESNFSEKIKILGLREDVNEILSAIDLIIMPSFFEGLPVTCVEFQSNGIPSLISDRITKEIGLYKTSYLPLEAPVELWSNKAIEKYKNGESDLKERGYGLEVIKENNYDIVYEAGKLCEFYLTTRYKHKN